MQSYFLFVFRVFSLFPGKKPGQLGGASWAVWKRVRHRAQRQTSVMLGRMEAELRKWEVVSECADKESNVNSALFCSMLLCFALLCSVNTRAMFVCRFCSGSLAAVVRQAIAEGKKRKDVQLHLQDTVAKLAVFLPDPDAATILSDGGGGGDGGGGSDGDSNILVGVAAGSSTTATAMTTKAAAKNNAVDEHEEHPHQLCDLTVDDLDRCIDECYESGIAFSPDVGTLRQLTTAGAV
jgi:hypothetical protein